MIYDVEFSLDAAAELLRISQLLGSSILVLKSAESIRRQLEDEPAVKGEHLSEGLFYIDEEPLRAFFFVDHKLKVVEITDFRVL